MTRFVGREQQIVEVRAWLERERLVTLVGVGGIGKTRLALEVARAGRWRTYEGGVWLVELAALADPALVPQAVAAALGVREERGAGDGGDARGVAAGAARAAGAGQLRAPGGGVRAACASGCCGRARRLRVLATSREALGVAGEAVWAVPALAVPASAARRRRRRSRARRCGCSWTGRR